MGNWDGIENIIENINAESRYLAVFKKHLLQHDWELKISFKPLFTLNLQHVKSN